MIIRNNISFDSISWLKHYNGGNIGTFYEPESKEELASVCRDLYKSNQDFLIIGHTSNIYFTPGYHTKIVVSTRKVKDVKIFDNTIVVDCGVSVKSLSRRMVDMGIKGYYGLVDLPGTVGAAVYGNASCFDCSITGLLQSVEFLQPDGTIIDAKPNDLKFLKRSSAMKRGELEGVILSLTLKKELGDVRVIKEKAEETHQLRKKNQPAPQGTLGSIFADEGKPTLLNMILINLTKIYKLLLIIVGSKDVAKKRKHLIFKLLNATDVEPYIHHWDCYHWSDEQSHELFWKFVSLHKKMFTKSVFEIEIKQNETPSKVFE